MGKGQPGPLPGRQESRQLLKKAPPAELEAGPPGKGRAAGSAGSPGGGALARAAGGFSGSSLPPVPNSPPLSSCSRFPKEGVRVR